MITEEELQAIRARAAAATPGPWRWRELGGEIYLLADHGKRHCILSDARTRYETGVLVEAKAGMPNPDFIAAAREDVPRLVEEVERLQADRGCWKNAYEEERRLLQTERQRADDLAARLAAEKARNDKLAEQWSYAHGLEAQLAALRELLGLVRYSIKTENHVSGEIAAEWIRRIDEALADGAEPKGETP